LSIAAINKSTERRVNKKSPKISIITPSLNQGKYLEQTILSVLSQDYPNLEYIIIDGGSTDNSLEIIKKYETKLHFWVSEPDNGLYDALQKGFDKSTGEIMGWLNSDDLYHPNALNIVGHLFQHFSAIKWLTGAPTIYDELGRVTKVDSPLRWSKYMYYNSPKWSIQQESTFWHRDLWEKSGAKLNTNLRYAGDYDLFLRFFRHEKLYSISTLIGGFRERATQQLTLEGLADYYAESKSVLSAAKKHFSIKDQLFSKLVFFDKLLVIVPSLRRLYFWSKIDQTLFHFPKRITFNRIKQQFEIND